MKKHLPQKEASAIHLINVVTTTVQGVQQQPYDTKKLKEFALYGYIAAPRLVQC